MDTSAGCYQNRFDNYFLDKEVQLIGDKPCVLDELSFLDETCQGGNMLVLYKIVIPSSLNW